MGFLILPNWGKRLGLFIFIFFEITTAGEPFMDGFKGVPSGTHHFLKDFYGLNLFYFLDALPLVGLLIYMLSKEKVEDDYIKLLRLESYQITIIILLIVALIIYLFDVTFKVSLDMVLPLFMLLFLITFYFKKRVR